MDFHIGKREEGERGRAEKNTCPTFTRIIDAASLTTRRIRFTSSATANLRLQAMTVPQMEQDWSRGAENCVPLSSRNSQPAQYSQSTRAKLFAEVPQPLVITDDDKIKRIV